MTAEDHYYAGIDFFGEGKLDEAIAEYNHALEIDPKFADALHGLAQAYHAKKDFDHITIQVVFVVPIEPNAGGKINVVEPQEMERPPTHQEKAKDRRVISANRPASRCRRVHAEVRERKGRADLADGEWDSLPLWQPR